MKKSALLFAAVFTLMISGCSKKQEPTVAKVETNTTTETQVVAKPAVKEVTKTIKRTNVTINSYSECPSFKKSDYTTIPYE